MQEYSAGREYLLTMNRGVEVVVMAIQIYNMCNIETTEDTECTEHFYFFLCPSATSVLLH